MVRLSVKGIVFLLFMGVLVFSMTVPAMAAAGAQNWYLDSTNHPVLTTVGKVMEKGPAGYGKQSGSVAIAAGRSQIWLADEAAVDDHAFPKGAWYIHLSTEGYWGAAPSSDKCKVAVGEWDINTATFTAFSTTETRTTWDSGKHIRAVELQQGSQTIHEGNYLALKVTNESSANHTVYTTDGTSFVESPGSDPGYPTPEIASGVLLGVGLLGLVGYLVTRRHAKASAKA